MAQPIAPELWQEGIEDNRFLPGRRTVGLFTGNGVKIANNAQACRVWDINVSDYITDYDDRRINGYDKVGDGITQIHKNDGWGASAWGVFQEVRFTSRVYTMGRHRSTALRVFEEMQYSGGVGEWGTATTSNVITNGQALMQVAALISKAKKMWQDEVLDPDIDKYNLFSVCSGHISGRCVGISATYNDRVFDGDAEHYKWIAQPGMMEGSALPPRFAPIHGIQWDDQNVAQMLQNIKVTWNNLNIPQENRVILLDPFYEIKLMRALTGAGIPATEAAYNDVKNGSFARLMGWDFDFSIPTNYWPKLYFDNNLNVCHGSYVDGTWSGLAADNAINSIAGNNGPSKLLEQLIAADRMSELNWIRTTWDASTGTFVKTLTNYPLGQPWADGFYGDAVQLAPLTEGGTTYDVDYYYGQPTTYPFSQPGDGYGLHPYDGTHTGSAYATGKVGDPVKRQIIGLALYKPAAQLSQEYSEMRTEDGGTRGKFTEMVFDVKYDAWVIERLACGILPIIAGNGGEPVFGLPVSVVDQPIATVSVPSVLQSATAAKTAGTDVHVDQLVWASGAPVSPTLAYKWQVSDTETGTYTDVASSVAGYNAAALTAPTANKFYRCVITASGTGSGTVTTNVVKYTAS